MSIVNPYCTVAEVQAELRNDDSDLDTVIESAILQASRFVDFYTGRTFFEHDYSSTAIEIDSSDDLIFGKYLFLTHVPVIEVTGVTVAETDWTVDEDYVVKSEYLISLSGSWDLDSDDDVVSILGRFGYAQRDAPTPPATLGAINHALVPDGMPENVRRGTVLIAACYSGHLQREVVSMDGGVQAVTTKTVPKEALMMLGNRKIIL